MYVSVHVPHAAKDREQNSQGRSPDFWLQTHYILSSHPQLSYKDSDISFDTLLTSHSSATAPDFHRLPYYALAECQGHPVRITLISVACVVYLAIEDVVKWVWFHCCSQ